MGMEVGGWVVGVGEEREVCATYCNSICSSERECFFLSSSFPSSLSLRVKRLVAHASARATLNLYSLLFLPTLTRTLASLCILALELER